jgi:hypothetical protein
VGNGDIFNRDPFRRWTGMGIVSNGTISQGGSGDRGRRERERDRGEYEDGALFKVALPVLGRGFSASASPKFMGLSRAVGTWEHRHGLRNYVTVGLQMFSLMSFLVEHAM